MSKVTVVDKGWKKLLDAVEKTGGKKLRVGVVGDEAKNEVEDGGITMARLAGVHEYGAAIQLRNGTIIHIPERSFIRATISENNNYRRQIEKLLFAIAAGKYTEDTALRLLGEKVVADIKKRMSDGIDPPNAP